MRKTFYSAIFLLLIVANFSCGYSTRSSISSAVHTIYIQPFKNSISFTTDSKRNLYLPLLEVKVKNEIVDRFLFDGNLKISKEDHADWVLKGELKSYDRSGLRYSENDDVQEYRITITVALELWDQNKNELIWSEPSFSGEGTYFVSGSQASSEDSAVSAAMTDLARRVVERTVEDW